MNTKRVYVPDYYRKDRLSGDDINSKELRSFEDNDSESDSAWTDKNVSKYPKFYNSEITNELTNVGLFFDKNNQYNDKTSHNTDVLTSDNCFIDKFGKHFCEDNTRLQNIPPSLITDINKCEILNNIGSYKDKIYQSNDISQFHVENINDRSYGVWTYENDKVINGGNYYNEITGSLNKNETQSIPLQPLLGECSL